MVEAMAIIELSCQGQEICEHVASKKDALETENVKDESEPETDVADDVKAS